MQLVPHRTTLSIFIMYNLSRDYERLYNTLCAGSVAAGFVDYKWNPNNEHEKPMRDIVEIERRSEWNINLGCRGKSYGYVLSRLNDEPKSELECFAVVCKSLNLEWIDPFLKTLPHQHCKTHGAAPPNVWACPECLVMLRDENKALRARVAELEENAARNLQDSAMVMVLR